MAGFRPGRDLPALSHSVARFEGGRLVGAFVGIGIGVGIGVGVGVGVGARIGSGHIAVELKQLVQCVCIYVMNGYLIGLRNLICTCATAPHPSAMPSSS